LVLLLHKRGGGAWFSALRLGVIRTGEWSEDRSKQDLGKAESWGMPLVTQKSSRSVTFDTVSQLELFCRTECVRVCVCVCVCVVMGLYDVTGRAVGACRAGGYRGTVMEFGVRN
jgi:hypothetical protein